MDKEQISLNKYISSSGFCSRREADKLIDQARVTINGRLVINSVPVKAGDKVEIDGEPLRKSKVKPVYIACNKPMGVTSTTDPKDRSNIIYYLGHPKRIFPVGRLDKDSDGLIFLTNDGDIVNKILRASNHHEKEYVVNVDKAITPEFIKRMSEGIPMMGTVTNKCFVRQEGGRRFRIILTQGLNRQIRRMCDALEYRVVSLTRVRVMNVTLEGLPVGKWRYLTQAEIDKLNELVADSSKTDVGAPKKEKIKRVEIKEEIQEEEDDFDENDSSLYEYTPERSGKKRSTRKEFEARGLNKAKGKTDGFMLGKPRDDRNGKAPRSARPVKGSDTPRPSRPTKSGAAAKPSRPVKAGPVKGSRPVKGEGSPKPSRPVKSGGAAKPSRPVKGGGGPVKSAPGNKQRPAPSRPSPGGGKSNSKGKR